MSESNAIEVSSLCKIYHLYNKPIDRLKEALNPGRKKYHQDFYALKDVSFEVKKGDTMGIIGQNGSGKSTLLKILSNVLTPTSGDIKVKGRVSSLLELGTGFNPELTGIENVYFNGTLLGFSREEMDAKLDDILSFADIGEFVNQPVKTYSSGMQVRLAFSVATEINPDILIVDEALSVGDMFFQAKCMSRMKKMIENDGTTLVFVSHAMDTVKSICSQAILLNKGQVWKNGNAGIVTEEFYQLNISKRPMVTSTREYSLSANNSSLSNAENPYQLFLTPTETFKKASFLTRFGNGKAEFLNAILLDENENEIPVVHFGQKVILRMAMKINMDISELQYGYEIRDRNWAIVVYGGSQIEDKNLVDIKTGDQYVIDWKFELKLRNDNYTITSFAAVPGDLEIQNDDYCDYISIGCQFEMALRQPAHIYGMLSLNNELKIIKAND